MQPRTYGAISMGSAGNVQGTYLFMSLLTWKTIRRRTWIEIPLPGEVIDLIDRKALRGTSITSDVDMRIGNSIIDDSITYMDEQVIDQANDEVQNLSSIYPLDEAVTYEDNNNIEPVDTIDNNIDNVVEDVGISGRVEPLEIDAQIEEQDVEFQPSSYEQNIINEDNKLRNDESMDTTHRYNLRESRSNWRERYGDHYATPAVLTNLSIPKAIKLYGTEALASVMKEASQLHDKGVWTPVNYDEIINKSKIII
jgi:hypothetical protein